MFDHTHQLSPFQETLKLYVCERLPLYLCCVMIGRKATTVLSVNQRMNIREKAIRSLESESVLIQVSTPSRRRPGRLDSKIL